MSAENKAKEIVNRIYLDLMEDNEGIDEVVIDLSKQCAMLSVDFIVEALSNYGAETDELQNMDREFVYWDKVKSSIASVKVYQPI